MPASLDRYYTREEVLAFPNDGNRYELVYGELLVSPSPALPHQRVLGRVFMALNSFVDRNTLGEVFSRPPIFHGGDAMTYSSSLTFSSSARRKRARRAGRRSRTFRSSWRS